MIIKNFSFSFTAQEGGILTFWEFVNENAVLLVVMLICLCWVIAALTFLVYFGAFRWRDKSSGYEIIDVEENKEASLNFFLTLIVPLLVDDVGTLQGAILFLCVFVMMCMLLYKTDLFYANPVLSLLGYRVYEFSFRQNSILPNEKYIGLCYGSLEESKSVEYKKITDKVLYVKGM